MLGLKLNHVSERGPWDMARATTLFQYTGENKCTSTTNEIDVRLFCVKEGWWNCGIPE